VGAFIPVAHRHGILRNARRDVKQVIEVGYIPLGIVAKKNGVSHPLPFKGVSVRSDPETGD
jgi:hypothetical protein